MACGDRSAWFGGFVAYVLLIVCMQIGHTWAPKGNYLAQRQWRNLLWCNVLRKGECRFSVTLGTRLALPFGAILYGFRCKLESFPLGQSPEPMYSVDAGSTSKPRFSLERIKK